MNQTTIIINWDSPGELIRQMMRVGRELANYNVYADDNVSIYSKFDTINVSEQKRFTSAQLAIVLDHFGARNKDRSDVLPSIRRLAWYYVLKNYPKTTYRQIAEVSGHDHSSVLNGFYTCVDELKTKSKNHTKDLRNEVFAKCDEVFKNKIHDSNGVNRRFRFKLPHKSKI